MMDFEDKSNTFYRVYNRTTDLLCSDFEDKESLKEYLRIVRSDYPQCEYVVYRITIQIFNTLMNW